MAVTDIDNAYEATAIGDEQALRTAIAQIAYPEADPFRLTQLAVHIKEAGYSEICKTVLKEAVRYHHHCAATYYELGIICLRTGDALAAISAFQHAIKIEPDDTRILTYMAHALFSVGAYPEGCAALDRARLSKRVDAEYIAQLAEFGKYIRDIPLGRALYLLDEVKRAYRWIGIQEVSEKIKSAIDQQRPFSLVRLGDGEGAFAQISHTDEQNFNTLYKWLRREWATLLFGAEFDPELTGYTSIVGQLMPVCASADIAGLPYQGWIEHEYRISSVRGIPGLMNIIRWFHEQPHHSSELCLCDQNVHIELHRQGFLESIITGRESVGLISSNSALPEAMRQRFNIGEIEFFKIPAEKYSGSLRKAEDTAGVHFPYRYWEINHQLSRNLSGKIFLIAAGTLAKYYAATIKKHGGIALDVGSLVDAWMKIGSRPGYNVGITM